MRVIWNSLKLFLIRIAQFKKRSIYNRYLIPFLLSTLIFPVITLIPASFFQLVNSQTISLLLFIFIVTISAWYGGLGPGLLATFLTAFISYNTLLRVDIFTHNRIGDLVIGGIYIIMGLLISIISEARYEADIQKDEFIALASHELKNPLTTIIGFSELLQRQKPSLKNAEYTGEIKTQAYKMLELINDLLDVSRIEIGKFLYKDEVFDFSSLIREIVRNQKVVNKNREIQFLFKRKAKILLEGDSYRIRQVIANLITNALKYSPQKSPIEIHVRTTKEKVILSVKDYGIGIPKNEQQAVFNQYYRSQQSKKRKTDGMGLGLFVASQIVAHHHGSLRIFSNGVKGATFYVTLPRIG